MRIKIILLMIVILGILALSLFASNIKDISIRGMVEKVPEYNCGVGDLCTSCIIEGYTCSCGKEVCSCGNKTVDREVCDLL